MDRPTLLRVSHVSVSRSWSSRSSPSSSVSFLSFSRFKVELCFPPVRLLNAIQYASLRFFDRAQHPSSIRFMRQDFFVVGNRQSGCPDKHLSWTVPRVYRCLKGVVDTLHPIRPARLLRCGWNAARLRSSSSANRAKEFAFERSTSLSL